MRRQWVIWLIYAAGLLIAFGLSSCAAQKPRYVVPTQTGEIRTRTDEGQRVVVGFHIVSLAMLGWLFHAFNHSSK